jgi:ankyrin repeat protein
MKHILITTIAAVVLVATTTFAGPIHDAAKAGDLAAVQEELYKGADVNAKDDIGRTPLTHAAQFGRKEVAELLIANGADVKAKNKYGWTPLYFAKTKETADLLRKHGGKTAEELKAEGK